MPTDPILPKTQNRPPNQVHLGGQGLALPVNGLDVRVGSLDADVVDLTPNDPLTLAHGAVDVRIHQASLAVPAAPLAAFLQQQLHSDSVKDLKLSFRAPNLLLASASVKLDGKLTPVTLEGRLLPLNGRLAFQPTSLKGGYKGFEVALKPQDGRATLGTSDQNLESLLLPKLNSKSLSEIHWHLLPGNQVDATATLLLAGQPAQLKISGQLGATPDQKLQIAAQHAHMDWRGLSLDAEPTRSRGSLHGDDQALTRLIGDELDTDKVRGVKFQFLPGQRFTATGEVLEGGGYRPVSIAGRLEARDGALALVPEQASIHQLLGGLDIQYEPQANKAQASVGADTLNKLLAPLAAEKGFEGFHLQLLDRDHFEIEGARVDAKHPGKRTPVKIEGSLHLDGSAVRFDFDRVHYGKLAVNFHTAGVELLQKLGLHLDDVIHLDSPVAKVHKDALYLYPEHISDRLSGKLTSLSVSGGRLNLGADVTSDVRSLLPFKQERFSFDGKAFLVTPHSVSERAAGSVTGVSTGNGTVDLQLQLTPEDLRHIVDLKSDKVDFKGDRFVIDPNKLESKLSAKVLGVTTREGHADVELGVQGRDLAGLLPGLPRGLAFNGQVLSLPLEGLDGNLHGAVTGVSVKDGELHLQLGGKARTGSGNQLEATSQGALEWQGLRIEDAQVSMTDRTQQTPLDPRRLKDGAISVKRGKVFVPRAKLESLLGQLLTPSRTHGVTLSYTGDGFEGTGKFWGIPLRAHVELAPGGAKGLSLSLSQVHLGPLPLPAGLATWLAGKLAKQPVAHGHVLVDLGKATGLQLGPLTQLKASPDGLALAIGE